MSRADIINGLRDLGLPERKIDAIAPLLDQLQRNSNAWDSQAAALTRIADSLERVVQVFGADDPEPISDRDDFIGHKLGAEPEPELCGLLFFGHGCTRQRGAVCNAQGCPGATTAKRPPAPESLLQDWLTSFGDCIEGGDADELMAATREAIERAKQRGAL